MANDIINNTIYTNNYMNTLSGNVNILLQSAMNNVFNSGITLGSSIYMPSMINAIFDGYITMADLKALKGCGSNLPAINYPYGNTIWDYMNNTWSDQRNETHSLWDRTDGLDTRINDIEKKSKNTGGGGSGGAAQFFGSLIGGVAGGITGGLIAGVCVGVGMAAMGAEISASLASLQTQINALNASVSQLQAKVTTVELENDGFRRDIYILQDKVKYLDGKQFSGGLYCHGDVDIATDNYANNTTNGYKCRIFGDCEIKGNLTVDGLVKDTFGASVVQFFNN
jgi:hypothetical protein